MNKIKNIIMNPKQKLEQDFLKAIKEFEEDTKTDIMVLDFNYNTIITYLRTSEPEPYITTKKEHNLEIRL